MFDNNLKDLHTIKNNLDKIREERAYHQNKITQLTYLEKEFSDILCDFLYKVLELNRHEDWKDNIFYENQLNYVNSDSQKFIQFISKLKLRVRIIFS